MLQIKRMSAAVVATLMAALGLFAGLTGAARALPATKLAITAPASTLPGLAFSITVTAQDPTGATDTTNTNTIHLVSSDTTAVLPADAPLVAGVKTFTVTLNKIGPQTITASDATNPLISSATTSPAIADVGPAVSISVTPAATSQTAGTAFNVTVTAKDSGGDTALGYNGTVHLTSTDLNASLPADTALTNGTKVVSVILKTTPSATITAADIANQTITGTSGTITVAPGALSKLIVSASPHADSGIATTVTVTASDAFGNTETRNTDSIHITISDGSAAPADAPLSAGTHNFSVTINSTGNRTVTATDVPHPAVTGTTATIVVTTAGVLAQLGVSAPANATAGTSFGSIVVTAEDGNGVLVSSSTITVHLTTSDAQASGTMPADAALSSGTNTFSGAVLKTAGNQTITATDTGDATISGISNKIAVAPSATASTLTVTGPSSVQQGANFTVKVTPKDQYGNALTSYGGTLHFTSTDGAATLHADSTMSTIPETFVNVLNTVGSQTVTATDTVTSSITGTTGTITVNAARTFTRLAGSTRLGTAIAVSQNQWPGTHSATVVVLARSDDFADALAGDPLAVLKHGPLLITPNTGLDSAVNAEIQRVAASGATVYVLGGTAALPMTVDSQLSSEGYVPTRIAGTDRFDTAVRVATNGLGSPTTVLLATGFNFPDAVSAGPAAAKIGAAVLLTANNVMPATTHTYLTNTAKTVYALGGPAAGADPSATPLVGATRYETAAMVATHFFPSPTAIGVATGGLFPDALSGGAQMGVLTGPIVLLDPTLTTLPSAVATYITAVKSLITNVVIYGGSAAISGGQESSLMSAFS